VVREKTRVVGGWLECLMYILVLDECPLSEGGIHSVTGLGKMRPTGILEAPVQKLAVSG